SVKRRRGKTGCGEAEDAGGLTPAKDNNEVHALFWPPNFTDFQLLRLYIASFRIHDKKGGEDKGRRARRRTQAG
ncbi:hypothetical protein DK853_28475, partial [Klebsiella oxytoca]